MKRLNWGGDMKAWGPSAKMVFLLLAGGAVACTGVQTGDGDSTGPCEFSEEPLVDFAEKPEGFEQTPREMMGPVTSAWELAIAMSSGKSETLTFEFEVDETAEALALYRFDASGGSKDGEMCAATGVDARGTLTISGGTLISGSAQVRVSMWDDRGNLGVDLAEFTLDPSLADKMAELGDGPFEGMRFPLQLDSDCVWRGEIRLDRTVSCEGKKLCSGFESELLATIEGKGNCSSK